MVNGARKNVRREVAIAALSAAKRHGDIKTQRH
jgi:hypothetical protein